MNIGENLWHDIVEKLKEEFSETTVGLWFGSATIGSLDGDSVTIVAEDDFKKSIIEKKYLPVLERMFEELLGFKVEVRVDSATGDSDARSEERLFVTSAPPARPDPAAQESRPPVRTCAANTRSTTSSSARPTSSRRPPPTRWRSIRPSCTTRFSSSARRVWAKRICCSRL